MTAATRPLALPRGLLGLCLLMMTVPATAAETTYPFEGTWVRADRACTPTVRSRTYTAKEVVSPRGRCMVRRVAASGSTYELQEDCRLGDRSTRVDETIRMTSADSMALKRQLNRLKIPHQVRYTRCTIAAPAALPGRPAKPPESKKP